jgi:hypothetical protein
VYVKVKNFSNSTQTRNVQLFVNGAPAGPGQLVTVKRYDDNSAKFEVRFNKGTSTLSANLFPGDSNPSNDNRTRTVKVRGGGSNDDDDDGHHHDKDDDDRGGHGDRDD